MSIFKIKDKSYIYDNKMLNRAQRRIRKSKFLATRSVVATMYILGASLIVLATIKLAFMSSVTAPNFTENGPLIISNRMIKGHKVKASMGSSFSKKTEKAVEIAMVRDRKDMGIGTSRGNSRASEAPMEESFSKHDQQWIDNINRFLSGSPMAGRGEVFYKEARKQGIDPRLSPSIARVESGLGAATPGGFNAYGMTAGTVPGHPRNGVWQAFSSWDDAITCHIAYIKRMWGPTAGPFNMKGYATSPTWPTKVSGAMSMIPDIGEEPLGPISE